MSNTSTPSKRRTSFGNENDHYTSVIEFKETYAKQHFRPVDDASPNGFEISKDYSETNKNSHMHRTAKAHPASSPGTSLQNNTSFSSAPLKRPRLPLTPETNNDDEIDNSDVALDFSQPEVALDFDFDFSQLSLGSVHNDHCDSKATVADEYRVLPSWCAAIYAERHPLTRLQPKAPDQCVTAAILTERGDALQEKAIEIALQGHNLFLTGKAGTGKSWTTRKLLHLLRSSSIKRTHVTAPTGIAAINVGGVTIHTWGGFEIGDYYSRFAYMMSERNRARICATDVLLIDEISMLNGHLLDVLECMVSIIRYYDKSKECYQQCENKLIRELLNKRWQPESDGGLGHIPLWGRMQVIVIGDFHQLPPVPNLKRGKERLLKNEELCEDDYAETMVGVQPWYAFQSHAWRKSNFQVVELTECHRQQDQAGFIPFLNAMREGLIEEIRNHHGKTLYSLRAALPERDDGVLPTELFSTNKHVDLVNQRELDKLEGPEFCFCAVDEVTLADKYKGKLIKKYSLEKIRWIPYLWSAVEGIRSTHRLLELWKEIADIDDRIKDTNNPLELEEKKRLREKRRRLEDEKDEIEDEQVMTKAKVCKALDGELEFIAIATYENYKLFEKQAKEDMNTLRKHAEGGFFKEGCRAPKEIQLKTNAQVLLLQNLDLNRKLANGSRGVVTEFVSLADYRKLLELESLWRRKADEIRRKIFSKDKDLIEKNPITDGMRSNTSDIAPVGINETTTLEKYPMKDGMESKISQIAPVGVHETTSTHNGGTAGTSDDLTLREPSKTTDFSFFETDREKIEELLDVVSEMNDMHISHDLASMDALVKSETTIRTVPFVNFMGTKCVVMPFRFTKEFQGCGTASRWQFPLALAWAISIHKSQGMTINWLNVDLSNCFADGQAYVACSRGTSVQTMSIKNFSLNEIKTSPKVKEFYSQLHNVGLPSTIPTWDEEIQQDSAIRQCLESNYGSQLCRSCGARCMIGKTRSNINGNQGRWYITCRKNKSGNGHTFMFVS